MRHYSLYLAILLFVVLLIPPVRHGLEASMTVLMLLQLPLLAGIGCLLPRTLPARVLSMVADWNYQGITGLVLVSMVSAFWMLPRILDASVTEPLIIAAKYLSVPLLVGLPFALSWPHMGFIIRGLFLIELIATCFRLGWIYMISPERLCSNYLLDDQQRLGRYLLLIGTALLLYIIVKLIWGRFESLPGSEGTNNTPT